MSEMVRALLPCEEVLLVLCGHVVQTKRPLFRGHFTGSVLLIFDPATVLPQARIEVLLEDEEASAE